MTTVEEYSISAHLIRHDRYFATRTAELDPRHVKALAAVIRRGGEFGRVLLWQGPRGLSLLDGEHRLAAYGAVKWTGGIPAKIVHCDRRTALLMAAGANSEDTKPLSLTERLDLAWRLVRDAEGGFSKAEIVRGAGVGNGTVGNMRKRWVTMQGAGEEPTGAWRRDQRDPNRWECGDNEPPNEEARRREVAERAKAVLNALEGAQRYDDTLVGDILQAALGDNKLQSVIEYLYGPMTEEFDEDDDALASTSF